MVLAWSRQQFPVYQTLPVMKFAGLQAVLFSGLIPLLGLEQLII